MEIYNQLDTLITLIRETNEEAGAFTELQNADTFNNLKAAIDDLAQHITYMSVYSDIIARIHDGDTVGHQIIKEYESYFDDDFQKFSYDGHTYYFCPGATLADMYDYVAYRWPYKTPERINEIIGTEYEL